MERITLSERFKHIKTVGVDCTDSEPDFSDNELFPKHTGNDFKYCTPAIFYSAKHEETDHVNDELDSDDDEIEMMPDWKELYQKILKKSKVLIDHHETHTGLCDKIPQMDKSLPLRCLRDSLEQYNKLSQEAHAHTEGLTADEITIERNDVGMDSCVGTVDREEMVKHVDTVGRIDTVEDIYNVEDIVSCVDNIEYKQKVVQNEDTLIRNVITNTNDTNKCVNEILNESDSENVEKIIGRPASKNSEEDNIELLAADEIETSTDKVLVSPIVPISNNSHTFVKESKLKENKLPPTAEWNERKSTGKDLHLIMKTEHASLLVSSCARETNTCLEKTENQTETDHTSHSIRINQEPVLPQAEEVVIAKSNGNPVSKTGKTNANTCINEFGEIRTETIKTLDGFKAGAGIACSEMKATVGKPSKHKYSKPLIEKKQDKLTKGCEQKAKSRENSFAKSEVLHAVTVSHNTNHNNTQIKKIVPQKSSDTQIKSVQFKYKNSKKVKSFEIKPASSFPLDDLLPPLPAKKRKASEDIKLSFESADIPRKRHTSEMSETIETVAYTENDNNQVPPYPFMESGVFHGTVYEGSPDGNQSLLFNEHINMDTAEEPDIINTTGSSFTGDFDMKMANLMVALQNGNQQVITMFQAALHDQIGSNLEALAFKARHDKLDVPESCDETNATSFGFYTERREHTCDTLNETRDNSTGEKYDELFHLFVEQCSALVKTKEDSCKLKSLLKVLETEGASQLIRTGFTPTEVETSDCGQVSLLDNSEMKTSQGTSPDGSLVGVFAMQDIDIFEGRTLLKGGVKTRHIPKTKIPKSGQDEPKDPRNYEKNKFVIKCPLPLFALELYGKKRVEKMLHLDWDAHMAQLSVNKNQTVSVNVKDSRMKSSVDSNIRLIADATKTLIEYWKIPQENASLKTEAVEDTTSGDGNSSSRVPVLVGKEHAQYNSSNITHGHDRCDNDARNMNIPVLITKPSEISQITDKRTVNVKDRNSILLYIPNTDLGSSCINQSRSGKIKPLQDRKTLVDIVSPKVQQSKTNNVDETRPSVGIVKPIQIIKPTLNSKNPLNKTEKISPLLRNRQTVDMKLDSDIEDGEIKTVKDIGLYKEGRMRSNTDINLTSGTIGDGQTNTDNQDPMTRIQKFHEKVRNCDKLNISLSSISSYEDGQIDSELDKSFNETRSTVRLDKKKNSGDKQISRTYRQKKRSSSISSQDSSASYTGSTRTSNQDKDRKRRKSESLQKDRSTGRSERRNRSRSRDRFRIREPSVDDRGSHHYHRQRHHTSKDIGSSMVYSDKSKTTKRHHSLGNETNKRHKTVKSRISNKSSTSRNPDKSSSYTDANQRSTHFCTSTNVIDLTLSDENLSKEYHEKYGNTKTTGSIANSTSNRLDGKKLGDWFASHSSKNQSSNLLTKKHQFSLLSKNKEVKLENYKSNISVFVEKPSQKISGIKKKSLEEQEKEVLADKTFLENCKKKLLGSAENIFKKKMPDSNTNCRSQSNVN